MCHNFKNGELYYVLTFLSPHYLHIINYMFIHVLYLKDFIPPLCFIVSCYGNWFEALVIYGNHVNDCW